MSARDYNLCVSPLTGTVYIAKLSKKDKSEMTTDRVEVPKPEFIGALVDWVEVEMNGKGAMGITAGGKEILSIEKPKPVKKPVSKKPLSELTKSAEHCRDLWCFMFPGVRQNKITVKLSDDNFWIESIKDKCYYAVQVRFNGDVEVLEDGFLTGFNRTIFEVVDFIRDLGYEPVKS